MRLGTVAGHGSFDPDGFVQVEFSGSKYPSNVKSAFIRFHHSATGKIDPVKFQGSARSILDSFTGRMKECLVKKHQVSSGSEALIYENEMAETIFGSNYSPEQLYAIHLFLWGSQGTVIKDVGYRATPCYHLRSAKELKLLEAAQNLKGMDKFWNKLWKIIYDGEPKSFNSDELTFIEILKAYSTINHINLPGNPYQKTVEKLCGFLCRATPFEVRRILEKLDLVPESDNFDPIQKGSGVLQHESNQNIHNFHFGLPEAWDYPDSVEEEVMAIDSASTVEVDDAIRITDDGWVHVYIADASHYIGAGSSLDKLARNRVSSIYLPDKTVPMLPSPLTQLMSLSPDRLENPSLTFSAKLGSNGDILDYKIRPMVLKNVLRFTYESAPIKQDHVQWLRKHFEGRIETGHVPFAIPKPKASLLKDGGIQFEVEQSQSMAHFFVSESMLLAGRIAAMLAKERKLPIPFRYHPEPSPLDDDLLGRIRTGKASRYDQIRLMLSMSPSAVHTRPLHHWAMGLDMYAKATSPIRRYLDLILHHQVKASLASRKPLGEAELASIIPSVYRHEQYLKHVQKASVRYWTLRHLENLLAKQESHGNEHEGLLKTKLILLDPSPLTIARQKVWIESVGLIVYGSLLGRLPTNMQAGQELEGTIHAVSALRSTIEILIQ